MGAVPPGRGARGRCENRCDMMAGWSSCRTFFGGDESFGNFVKGRRRYPSYFVR